MKLLRPIGIVLAGTISLLMIAQTAAAEAQGKGGQGKVAAVGIDQILLPDPQGGFIIAEISGGGFEAGDFEVEVLLDDDPLKVVSHTSDMVFAKIPKATAEGDHVITVRTGFANKQSASTTIRLGGELIVSCISWFVSGPADEHVHTEVHVEDENGDAVIGATVTWEAENPSGDVYQTNTSATHDNDGHAKVLTTCPLDGNGEPDVSGSGVTDWFCCIGAGKFDLDGPPGKRACEAGTYTARILDVSAPPFTNMVWDDASSVLEASIDLVDPKFP